MQLSKGADHQQENGHALARIPACCVIVTYLPAHAPLLRQVEAIRPQGR